MRFRYRVAPLLAAVLVPLTVLVHLDQISNPVYPEEVFC